MNDMTTIEQGGALAAPGGYDPFAAYGQEAANAGALALLFKLGDNHMRTRTCMHDRINSVESANATCKVVGA